MNVPSELRKRPECGDWCILAGYRGSIAHGMYVPSSDPKSIDDKDLMFVCVPPIQHYFGLSEFGTRGTRELVADVDDGGHTVRYDAVVYEAKKFVYLLSVGNPNVLSMLWLPDKHYIKLTDAGRLLIDNRREFVGKHVYRSFVGYAKGQLHRMEHWKFEGYMGTKRKQLVETLGYDSKNAAHLIRLLRMAIEFLTDGQLYVERYDAKELLEIKRGEWSLERIKVEGERLFALADKAYIESKLPVEPNRAKIEALCVGVVRLACKGAPLRSKSDVADRMWLAASSALMARHTGNGVADAEMALTKVVNEYEHA
jgi:predicted nucleotidyltransferase